MSDQDYYLGIESERERQSEKCCGNCSEWTGNAKLPMEPYFFSYCNSDLANQQTGSSQGLSTHPEFCCIHWKAKI